MKRRLEQKTWFLVAAGSAILAGMIAQRGLETGWHMISDEEPPTDPSRSDSWRTALAWAAVSATIVAAAQLAGRHGAQAGWKKVTGKNPPSEA